MIRGDDFSSRSRAYTIYSRLPGLSLPVSTYPLDLVRARLSIATATIARLPTTSLSANAKTNAQYSLKGKPVLDKDLGVWGMTLKVYRTEGGMKGLYRGMVATAVGVAPYVVSRMRSSLLVSNRCQFFEKSFDLHI